MRRGPLSDSGRVRTNPSVPLLTVPQGAGYGLATNTPVKVTSFQLDRGAELLKSFEASPGKQRVFCSVCGSPIYSKKDALPGVLRIRAGLINESLSVRPAAHFYTGSKANWWPINDDLPQFEAAYLSQSSKV